MAKTINILKQQFGRLTVIGLFGHGHHGEAIWTCQCSCGNYVEVYGSALRSGKTRSCGCLQHEHGVNQAKTIQPLAASAKRTHGETGTRMYKIWAGMIQRCTNPKREAYKYYGGRGISVCDKWRHYEGFKEDMEESYFDGASIDRIDNDKGYEPGNCRWVTTQEQFSNRRNKVRIFLEGRSVSVSEAAHITDKSKRTLYKQLKKGVGQ